MPDMTVTWPGAVPFDAAFGQQNSCSGGREVMFDAAAMAGSKFDIRPVYSDTQVSMYEGAVPYSGTDEFEVLLDGYAEVADEIVTPKKRVKKVVD